MNPVNPSKAVPSAEPVAPDVTTKLLTGAFHALRSYQFGNASEELAESMADEIEKYLEAR